MKREEKEYYTPIDIVYVPVKGPDEIINCYFTDNIHLANRGYCSRESIKTGNKTVEKVPARQYYYCNKYFANFTRS